LRPAPTGAVSWPRARREAAQAIAVRSTWAGTHALTTEATRDGAVIGSGTYAVSADGQTLTATVAGIDAAGKHFEQVIVFDRLPD
jgi:hypothetical protein